MEFWKKRWDEGRTRFHLSEYHPTLMKYSTKLELDSPKRVLIPLCGKTLDLKWFYENGHYVTGVEGVESPVSDFFNENDIEFSVIELSWGKLYQSANKRLKIYVGNLFDVNLKDIGKFDIVWDRGSLVAIDIKDQERYAELITQLLDQSFHYLLSTVQYTGDDFGPPHSVSLERIETLFSRHCDIELLCRDDYSETNRWETEEFYESSHLLTQKK